MEYRSWQTTFALMVLFSASALSSMAGAQGFILPFSGSSRTPNLIQQNTTIAIHDDLAFVQVRQIFENPYDRTIEGFYLHPLPTNAESGSVVLRIKGRPFQGEILDQSIASDTYAERFRKTGNRVFLTMIQRRMYKARTYPFFPGQKLELYFSYSMRLTRDPSRQRKLSYPLFTSVMWPQNASLDGDSRYMFASSRTSTAAHFRNSADPSELPKESLTVEFSGPSEIGAIFSTTHSIKTIRASKRSARVRVDMTYPVVDNEFVLYFGTREKDVDINILSYDAQGDEDGYFVATISPRRTVLERRAVPKDIVFILDLSNGMKTQQVKKSRAALGYCITNLNRRDRFNIITFATDVRLFQKHLVPASEYRAEGLAFLNDLRPRGGANLHSAILTALSLKGEPDRESRTIILLTSGAYTVGVTDASQIVDDIASLNAGGYPIHAFNVGGGGNDRLLSRVGQMSGGYERLVPASANIVSVVSDFYDSIDLPIMSSPEMTFAGMEVYDVNPARLRSVVADRQQQVSGRFKGSGSLTVMLSGLTPAGKQQFTCETEVGGKASGNDRALSSIWARMKLASLRAAWPLPSQSTANLEQLQSLSRQFGVINQRTEGSGDTDFALSAGPWQGVRYINDKVFRRNLKGGWLESGLSPETTDKRQIPYRSQEYYDYVQENPGAAQYLAIGSDILFQFDDTLVKIDDQFLEEGRILNNGNSESK